MNIIAYVKDYGEKIFIGSFETLEDIHTEIEMKLIDLDLEWMIKGPLKRPVYIAQGANEYKLLWGGNKK